MMPAVGKPWYRTAATEQRRDLVHLAERPDAVTVGDPKAALEKAKDLAGPGGAVVAAGSIYLIADLIRVPGQARISMI